MATIYTIHAARPEHLDAVIASMRGMGAPTIRVVDCGDHYMALEGTHRLHAAQTLGLAPRLVVIDQDADLDITAFDWYDAANFSETVYPAGEIAAEVYSPSQAQALRFDTVEVL